MTFCDLFFDSSIKTLDDETSKGPKKSSELYALRTREHILAHEFFHCDIFGFSPTHSMFCSSLVSAEQVCVYSVD